MRECGLKYQKKQYYQKFRRVTPCAGVWIEILYRKSTYLTDESLPVRECGLKYA